MPYETSAVAWRDALLAESRARPQACGIASMRRRWSPSRAGLLTHVAQLRGSGSLQRTTTNPRLTACDGPAWLLARRIAWYEPGLRASRPTRPLNRRVSVPLSSWARVRMPTVTVCAHRLACARRSFGLGLTHRLPFLSPATECLIVTRSFAAVERVNVKIVQPGAPTGYTSSDRSRGSTSPPDPSDQGGLVSCWFNKLAVRVGVDHAYSFCCCDRAD